MGSRTCIPSFSCTTVPEQGHPASPQPPPQIIISTGISYGVNLKSKFGISVVGDIPSG